MVKAFAIVIVGGLGSIPGSIIASLILGYSETIVAYLISTSWTELVSLVAVVVTLMIRPSGLSGDGRHSDMKRIAPIDIAGGILVVAFLALLPMFAASNYLTGVLTVCVIYGIWASSWDFMSGLTGRENFGHSLFIGAGAYTAGFLSSIWSTNPWVSLPLGVVIAIAFSLLVGFPTLRLRGPYFALAMLVRLGDPAAAVSDLLGIYRRRGRHLRP